MPENQAIPGLHFDPDVAIPSALAVSLIRHIKEQNYFRGGMVNQLMLFERGQSGPVEATRDALCSNALPSFLLDLISSLAVILDGHIPSSTHHLLFPTASSSVRIPARQAILNLYRPGEGITPHVDLLQRFGDGIIIVSLGSGTVMELAPLEGGFGLHTDLPLADGGTVDDQSAVAPPSEPLELWLEPRSIMVMEGDARYKWTHEIPARDGDWVHEEQGESGDNDEGIGAQWIARDVRVSITLRWLLPGAEIVGGPVGFTE